jgi:hypothetical protein
MDIIEPAKWYRFIECERCKRIKILDELTAPDEATNVMPEISSWKCGYCGKEQVSRHGDIQMCQGIYL